MNRKLALSASFAALAVAATAAAAQPRPYAPAMTCQAAAALVTAHGAVVLGTGPYTYERVVVHGGLCPLEETTAPAWHVTADNPRCFVGYRCKDKFNEGSHRD
jgi:opacity protein-like surface antigen